MGLSNLQLYNPTEFYMATPMSQALQKMIQSWLWGGFNGGVVIGESRTGKSRALRELSSSIPSRTLQPIPIHRVVFGERDKKTIREAWMKIAKSTGLSSISQRTSAEALSSQVAFYLTEAALDNDTHQVIMIADEIQFLSINQLSVFAELHNMLDDAKINSLFVFVANQDMFAPMVAELRKKENTYIRERFFNNAYQFYGIRTIEELKSCLAILDGGDSTEKSITQTILPDAYEEGFKLADSTDMIWEAYCEDYAKYGSSNSWGMEYFTRFVKVLLLDYLPNYDWHSADNLKVMIGHSLKASGIKSMLNYL